MCLLHYNMCYTSNTFIPLEFPLYLLLGMMALSRKENSIGDPKPHKISLGLFFLIYVLISDAPIKSKFSIS